VTTGRTRQQTLAAVYDEGAAAYEKYWAPVLHRHVLDLVNTVTSATAPAPRIVVDVATGAGTLVPALRGLAGSGGRVIALDRSHGMLRRISPSVPRVQAAPQHCHFVRRPQTSWCWPSCSFSCPTPDWPSLRPHGSSGQAADCSPQPGARS
jgi:ubiquinone/menaquinone biosynthesis C-methylase UbiE